MSLTKQIHLFSIGTDAFYELAEQEIHHRLLKLYGLRKQVRTIREDKLNPKKKPHKFWCEDIDQWYREINNLINQEKDGLVALLNKRLESHVPRQLNPEVLKDKAVVSLFESSLTRAMNIQTNELTKDIIVINVFFFQVFEGLVKDGFDYDGEHYVFLTASAGQIRTKRSLFVKQSAYEQIKGRMMCGLTFDDINKAGGINPNKFLAYLALNNSATDVWEDFDIDKSIVVEDFETNVRGDVDFIDNATYDIERKNMDVPIPHMDGAGIMLDKPTRMVRMPWVKGLLVYFPYDKFVQEKCQEGQQVVTDIYGQEHDVVAEGIKYIFTKSQFKLWKYYRSWDDYKAKFKANQCEACYCNMEESYLPKNLLNYQMLQTLSNVTDEEIKRLVGKSIHEIETIGTDYQTTMRLLGATEYNSNKSWFQEALMMYPELFRDPYVRDILKQTKKSLVKKSKAGRLRVNGEYRFLSPDLYAFCEWLFLGIQEPNGLLDNHEVYVKDYGDGNELACLRSPHLYKEWAIRNNKRSEELDKWFGDTKCVYTSCHDLISKVLQFD